MSKHRYSGVEETRQRLPSLLDDAHAGRPVVITKHGRPYAAIVPLDAVQEAGPRPSMMALRGSGVGLWGDDVTAWVDRLREEW
jgi:prevent-host-death family protein